MHELAEFFRGQCWRRGIHGWHGIHELRQPPGVVYAQCLRRQAIRENHQGRRSVLGDGDRFTALHDVGDAAESGLYFGGRNGFHDRAP